MVSYITECPIIPDPELNWEEMPASFKEAVREMSGLLQAHGIHEEITTTLKQFTGGRRCWLALYVRGSQFRGLPIFEVNTQTPGIVDAAVLPQSVTVEDVFIDSLLHEYGHVIEEYARQGYPDQSMKRAIYGPFSDEEDFAEYMVDYFRYHKDQSPRKKVVDSIMKMYVEDVF